MLDAQCGVLAINPNDAVSGYYQVAQTLADKRQKQQAQAAAQLAYSRDNKRIDIAANIGTALEAPGAFANGAEGVGLFRTEMLYMDRDSAPDEQEQFEAYQQVLLAAGDKPIILRTMDIGGDKSIPYLNIPQEENPFLGYRAVRIYPEFAGLFRTQLRAILRAASFGNAQLMIPMVHSLDQILWVKGEIQKAIVELKRDGLRHAETITLGIMVEVPSVCYIIDHFCDEVDFFSIGSNDMTQYLYAVDRNNPRVSPLYNPITPSFLRMLQQIVTTAHQRGKWVGICGELGGESRYLPLLLGLGLDELSMSSPRIPAVKSQLRQLDSEACRELARQACECRSAQEIEALLTAFTPEEDVRPLLALENKELQYNTAMKIFDEKLSVRETERLVKEILNPKVKKEKKVNLEEEAIYEGLEEKIKSIIGTKVSIHRGAKHKGKIEIEYYSQEELERIMDLFESIQ